MEAKVKVILSSRNEYFKGRKLSEVAVVSKHKPVCSEKAKKQFKNTFPSSSVYLEVSPRI